MTFLKLAVTTVLSRYWDLTHLVDSLTMHCYFLESLQTNQFHSTKDQEFYLGDNQFDFHAELSEKSQQQC